MPVQNYESQFVKSDRDIVVLILEDIKKNV
jgi:hypothetical protein